MPLTASVRSQLLASAAVPLPDTVAPVQFVVRHPSCSFFVDLRLFGEV